MANAWRAFRGFWNAEEIPRWFGLSIVLVYLVGLGTVAQFGLTGTRHSAARHIQRANLYAARQLASRLGHTEGRPWDDPSVVAALQRGVRSFSANLSARSVRIVTDQRRVLASTDALEVGTLVPNLMAGKGDETPVLRVPIVKDPAARAGLPAERSTTSDATPSVGDGGTTGVPSIDPSDIAAAGGLMLEASFDADPLGSTGLAQHAGTMTAVLVALGALFVIYRRLREQMYGLSRIGERLEARQDRIGRDLSLLRITDARDTVTTAWNELVDLTEDLTRDVERTEANEELCRALQSAGGGALSEALNALPDAFVYVAHEGSFEFLNATAYRLFGWDAEQAQETSLSDAEATGVGGRVLSILRAAQRPDGSFAARTESVEVEEGGDRECSSYRVWVLPLRRTQQDGGCVLLVRDVSQQVRAERARDDFVTQVTHELRTPLTNIRAYAETLSSGMFDDPKVVADCYNVITKETRRLSRLIEDILSVSQLEVGSIELRIDQVDLKTLLTDGIRDVRNLADEKNIDVQLVLPAKMQPVRADRDKLAVVINNLLGNAIKYTPEDGNVIVACQFSSDAVTLTFKDNGIGVDPADHARVFEKFQRADDPRVKNETGSGIGLYTAREIMLRHGGEIDLISEKDHGSTFIVRLPHEMTRAAAMAGSLEE